MFDLFPGRCEIKALAVGVFMAGEAMGFDGIGVGIELEAVFCGFILALHDRESFISAPGAVAYLTGYAFSLKLGGLVIERGMALQAFRVVGRVLDA
jgi:hypothetical protein